MSAIPPSTIRRVNRVCERIQSPEEPEEVLDDIFVLCRAFEATWSGTGGEREQAEEATVQAIRAHGIGAFETLRPFVESLRAFRTASTEEFAQWFSSEFHSPAKLKDDIMRTIASLRDAVESQRWGESDSKKLGKLIYRMRCAVIHPSLDTHNSLALPILPALRAALIELTIAGAAARYRVSLADARSQFGGAGRNR